MAGGMSEALEWCLFTSGAAVCAVSFVLRLANTGRATARSFRNNVAIVLGTLAALAALSILIGSLLIGIALALRPSDFRG